MDVYELQIKLDREQWRIIRNGLYFASTNYEKFNLDYESELCSELAYRIEDDINALDGKCY